MKRANSIRVGIEPFGPYVRPCATADPRHPTLLPTPTCLRPGSFAEILGAVLEMSHINYDLVALSALAKSRGEKLDWGHMEKNGSWTGVAGDLQNGTFHLLATPYAMQSDRSRTFLFADPLLDYATVAVFKKNYPEVDSNSLLNLFQPMVWGLSLIFLLLFPLLLSFRSTPSPLTSRSFFPHCGKELWVVVCYFCNQPRNNDESQQSRRVPLILLGSFVLFLFSLFDACLLSTLVARNVHMPFNSLEQLAEQVLAGKFTVMGGGGTSFWLDVTQTDRYPSLKRAIEQNPVEWKGNMSVGEIASQLMRSDGKQKVLIAGEVLGKLLVHKHCGLTALAQNLDIHSPSASFMLNPDQRDLQNKINQKIRENFDVFRTIIAKYDALLLAQQSKIKEDCSDLKSAAGKPLTLSALFAFFSLLGIGLAVATFIFMTEAVVPVFVVRRWQSLSVESL